MSKSSLKTLEAQLAEWASPAAMLQNSPFGEGFEFPVKRQWSNLLDEMESWRKSATLFDQSRHMMELYVKGPDVRRLLNRAAVNNFANFQRNQAKQIVCVNEDGYLVSDAIVMGLEDDEVVIVGRPCVQMWVWYLAESGGYDVVCRPDLPGWKDPARPRTNFRYEVMGPRALDILSAVNEGSELNTRFFGMGCITIAGVQCRTLCHTMGGAKGLELWGPEPYQERVEDALMRAGRAHGMCRGGARAYGPTAGESGWFAAPLPAIYTGAAMKAYREWLPAMSFEGMASVGGSFQPADVGEYYLTPFELGYGRLARYDHDFIGRPALERMKDLPHRRKVIFKWDKTAVLEILSGLMEPGIPPMFLDIPSSEYAWHHYDRIESGGALVGISGYPLYSANVRAWLSVGIIDPRLADAGGRATLVWGEPNGGTNKPSVHRHRQVEVGVEVCEWPIHEDVRIGYRVQQ
jgi:glycine cleavage system aminomethyltransferase T